MLLGQALMQEQERPAGGALDTRVCVEKLRPRHTLSELIT